jgi:hypothetical protein
MEIVFCGYTTELDDLTWRSDILDVRKRILSIVKKGGLLDSIFDDAHSSGETDFDLLIYKYLDFESKCQKILNELTEDEIQHHLDSIDVEAEFANRYKYLGIDETERIRLCLYMIEKFRIWEEKKVLMSENEGIVRARYKKLTTFLEIIRPKLDKIENDNTRNFLNSAFEEIEAGFSKSENLEYLRKQRDIIQDVQENLTIHLKLVDVMKRIKSQKSGEHTSGFFDVTIEMVSNQREEMIQKIEHIDNEFISHPMSVEFENIGKNLTYLKDQLQ